MRCRVDQMKHRLLQTFLKQKQNLKQKHKYKSLYGTCDYNTTEGTQSLLHEEYANKQYIDLICTFCSNQQTVGHFEGKVYF